MTFLPDIRFCGANDIPEILGANRLSPCPWPDAVIVRDLDPEPLSSSSKDSSVYLGAFARTSDSQLLGYAVIGYEASFALLMGLVVLPAYRRRGIGTQLVLAVEECARSIGRTHLVLRVGESNIPARTLYERLSFRRDTLHAGYYSNGEDAVQMSLPLPRFL